MFFLFSPAASAHAREVDFSPQVGANVQGSLELREMGAVRLGRYLGTRPVVLVLVYFGCRNLCPLLLDGVSEALARSGLKPDVDYAALFVSIDPRDEEAPPRRRAGWHLLTESGEFAHPTGFVVLTPQGEVARYFAGVRFDPQLVKAALDEAAHGKTSDAFERLLLLCFHDPVTGKYSQAALTSVRVAALLFLAMLGLFAWRRLKPRRPD